MASKKLNKAIIDAAMNHGKTVDEVNEIDDDKAIAQELVDKIDGMINDRDAKCASAKEQLIESLKITADKYITATGVAEARRVGTSIEAKLPFEDASAIARKMSYIATEMADMAGKLGYAEMDNLCKDFYDPEFARHQFDRNDLIEELMILDLCRNVGPAAEDMVEFFKRANEDITDTQAEFDALIAEHPEFADLTPTPKED